MLKHVHLAVITCLSIKNLLKAGFLYSGAEIIRGALIFGIRQ